ncbi:hypothetical protein QAD02_006695 [Eretmocerus hayati]|uniref:Uncharacterized protein n=1 Tax=Eretmocerus hayati TaxID=131215 RepID=A0ACC2N1M8_9HYME|nr:hypothetical protein QAD02_006695 [Eretmocerus hayati]
MDLPPGSSQPPKETDKECLHINGYTFTKHFVGKKREVHWTYTNDEKTKELILPQPTSQNEAALNSQQIKTFLRQHITQRKPYFDPQDVDNVLKLPKIGDEPMTQSNQMIAILHHPIIQAPLLNQSNQMVAIIHHPTVQQPQTLFQPSQMIAIVQQHTTQSNNLFQPTQMVAFLPKPTVRNNLLPISEQAKDTSQQSIIHREPDINLRQTETILDQSTCSNMALVKPSQAVSNISSLPVTQNKLSFESNHTSDTILPPTTSNLPNLEQVTDKIQQLTTEDQSFSISKQDSMNLQRPVIQAEPSSESDEVMTVSERPVTESQSDHKSQRETISLHQCATENDSHLGSEPKTTNLEEIIIPDDLLSELSQFISILENPTTVDEPPTSLEEEINSTQQSNLKNKQLAKSDPLELNSHRLIITEESPLDDRRTPSDTGTQNPTVVRQIGERLCVDGYVYVRRSKTRTGLTDWVCRRFFKKNMPQQCEAKAQTIVRSSMEISFRSGGPLESKHNHPPMTEDVTEAESLVSLGSDDFTYQFVSKANPSKKCRNFNQPHRLQDQCNRVSGTEAKELDLDMKSHLYRQFLMSFSEKPIFDEVNIMRALDASYNVKHGNRQRAYANIVANQEKIIKDLKSLTDDPKICKILTQDGTYSLYEPGDITAENFGNGQSMLTKSDSSADRDNHTGKKQGNVISSIQGKKKSDKTRPATVSLPINDLINYWPPIPSLDYGNDDGLVKGTAMKPDLRHYNDQKEKHGFKEKGLFGSNRRNISGRLPKAKELSGPNPQSSSHQANTALISSRSSQSNSVDIDKIAVTNPQEFLQNTTRYTTIDQIDLQSVLAVPKPPQSKSTHVNRSTVESIQGQCQNMTSSNLERLIITFLQDRHHDITKSDMFNKCGQQPIVTASKSLQCESGVKRPTSMRLQNNDKDTARPDTSERLCTDLSKPFQFESPDLDESTVTITQDHPQKTPRTNVVRPTIRNLQGPHQNMSSDNVSQTISQPIPDSSKPSQPVLSDVTKPSVTNCLDSPQNISRPIPNNLQTNPQSILTVSKPPQPELSGTKRQGGPISQSYAQKVSRPITINQSARQPILAKVRSSETSLPGVKIRIISDLRYRLRDIPRIVKNVQTKLKPILPRPEPLQSNSSDTNEQDVTKSKDQPQVISKPIYTVSQISPQSNIPQRINCSPTLNVLCNSVPQFPTINVPTVTNNLQVPFTQNLVGFNTFITPTTGQFYFPLYFPIVTHPD